MDGTLKSTVHGVEMTLDPPTMAEIFLIPNEGITHYSSRWDSQSYDLTACNGALIAGSPLLSRAAPAIPSVPQLSPTHHILFLLVDRQIIPHDRQDNQISTMVAFVMWQMLLQSKINLPWLMLRHMWNQRARQSVPYAAHLTRIFQHFRVPLRTNFSTRTGDKVDLTLTMLFQSHIYLHQERFIHEIEFQGLPIDQQKAIREHMHEQSAIRSGNVPEPLEEFDFPIDFPPAPQPEHHPPPSQASSSQATPPELMAFLTQRFDAMQAYQDARFAALEATQAEQFQRLHTRQTYMNERLDHVYNTVGMMSQSLDDVHTRMDYMEGRIDELGQDLTDLHLSWDEYSRSPSR